jgi:hypothetical protein
METEEEKLARFADAVRWAKIPENRDSLPVELQTLLAIVEKKLDELKPKAEIRMTVNFGGKNLQLALTPIPLPYYIRR